MSGADHDEVDAERVGHRYAGAIYGTILAMSVVAVSAGTNMAPWVLAIAVVTTSAVFWLAHAYAESVGRQIAQRRHSTFAERLQIAREEWPMVQASLPMAACLLLGSLGVLGEGRPALLAMVVGIVILAGWGYAVARAEDLHGARKACSVVVTSSFGLALLLLKVLVNH